jgi:hypothetical protein
MAFRLILTAIFILLLSANASQAEPVSAIVTAIGAAIKASLTAAALVKAALAIALNVGMGLIKQAQAKKAQRKQEPRGTTLSVQFGDTRPLSYIIGTRATAGRRFYAGTWGRAGKTPNAYATDCRVISDLPSYNGPQGLQEAWFGPTKGTILWDQPHPLGWGFPVLEFRYEGTDYLWVKYLDGTQTTADPFLLETFGGVANHPYLPTMIGRGCQLVIYTCRVAETFFPQGFPDALFVPKPMKLYDIRFDTTAGGSGPQRWGDVSTYVSSDLLPVLMYNVARGVYYDGKWVHGGRNFAAHRLPASSWMAAINEADRAMEEGRKQFRGGLEVFVDEEPLDTLEDLRVGCAGRLAEVGGALKLSVGSPAGAVFSFTDANVVVTSDQDYEPFPSVKSTHNTITSDYPEPKERWEYKDAPEKTSAELIARDGGQKLPVAVRFEAVPFSAQVQSLMTAMIAEEQRWRIHDLVLPPSAIGLEPNDVLSWSSEKQGYSAKRMIAVRVTRLTGSNVRVMMKEIDPNDYNPPTVILPPVIGWTGPITVPPQPMFGWTAVPDHVPDGTGTARRPGIRISCSPDQDDVQRVHVWVRVKATEAIVFDSDATAYASPHSWLLSGAWCLPATLYQARGQFLPYSRRPTNPSEWIDVLTPNILLGDADVYLPGMVEGLKQFVGDATEWVRDGTRQLILEQQRLARLTAETDIAAYTDRQTLRREVVATANDVTARYLEEIEVATGPNSALARRTQTLEAVIPTLATATAFNALVTRVTSAEGVNTAQALAITMIEAELPNKASASALSSLATTVTDINGKVTSQADAITQLSAGTVGGNTATANFRMGVSAGPAGYSSTIAMEVRSGGIGGWQSAGLFIHVGPSGSRIALQANQIAFTNGSVVKSPFVYEADTLFLDQAVIRQARIIDLMVGTSNIAAGAITDGGITENASDVTVTTASSGTWTTLGDITVNHGAGSPQVTFDVGAQFFQNQTTPIIAEVFDVTAATVLRSIIVDIQNNAFYTPFSYFGRFVPAAGVSSTVLRLRARVAAGTTTGFARSRVIRSMTFKR